ncbi:MAG: Beta-phosphoglucomutase [Chlamydiae bacterium]|nr:Beta-phosphoglucomutase [Chlamydiota bacterium]
MVVGFLFDNDGVLIDSCDLLWISWQQLMKEESEVKIDKETFVRGLGKTNALIFREIAPEVSEETRRRWSIRREAIFRELVRGKIELLPGIEPFLKSIKKAKIPRIIASSTAPENLEMYLSSTPLGHYFDSYVSAEETPRSKPFPDIFIAAAERLGLPPEECIVVEDAATGVEAGKSAGCFVVAIGTTHSQEALEGYDLYYSTPHELDLEIILEAFEKWHSR